jgi:hypothetical protein
MKNISIALFLLLLLTSCFKEEDKRPKIESASISMKLGEDYGNVFYYNLASQTIVSQNKWNDWDLAFYAQDDDFFIKLNHGANMKAFKTNATLLEAVTSLDPNIKPKVDDATGDRAKIALNYTQDFTSNDTIYFNDAVYILLLGTDALGNEMGYKKMKLDFVYQNHYQISYANLDNTEKVSKKIYKDLKYNYMYLSFKNEGEIVPIEPDKTAWDIVFTRSTDVTISNDFVDTIFDYSVTSVLLNPFSTTAYLENALTFEAINQSTINSSALTNQLNIIGYDWKAYDLTNGIYAVRENQAYVVRDINDFYYKIKFVSFYDPETTLKGTISFDYEIIK